MILLPENLKIEIEALVQQGLIWEKRHDHYDNLALYTYSPEVNAKPMATWSNAEEICRGLIVDTDTDTIIAQGYPKFWNVSQYDGNAIPIPTGPRIIQEKMDGSLGIAYKYDGKWAIATRGSFHSDQAEFATDLLNNRHSMGALDDLPTHETHMFEIIYPENRIVVDYGDRECICYLSSRSLVSGAIELHLADMERKGFEVAKTYRHLPTSLAYGGNAEGFVVIYIDGSMVKYKYEDYIMKHSIMTDMTPKKIWMWIQNYSIEGMFAGVDVPIEWRQGILDSAREMQQKKDKLIAQSHDVLSKLQSHMNEKECALAIIDACAGNKSLQSICFAIYRDIGDAHINTLAWNAVKPKTN